MNKYSRQVDLPNFGQSAQLRLSKAKVIIVGVGGVGSGALPLLASTGLGEIVIFDNDVVSLSNLHRQTLYSINDIDKSKAQLACEYAKKLNDDTVVSFYNESFSANIDSEIFRNVDILIDATDSFASRFSISNICRNLGIKVISATAQGYVSQNFLFGEGFYIDNIVDNSLSTQKSQGLPIFPASAHLSGVWSASNAIKCIALNEYKVGDFSMLDISKNKYYTANLYQ